MRVLIFSLAYYPRFVGGAEVALKEIADRLPQVEFDMITLRKHAPAFERIGNVNVYRVGWQWRSARTASSKFFPLSKTCFPLFAAIKGRQLHRARKYNVVWSMMAAYAGVGAILFKLTHPSVPLLLTLQEGDPISHIKRRALPIYPLFRRIFTRADHIQVISQYLADFARGMGATAPITLIPNGVDVARFSAPPKPLPAAPLLVTASRLVPKNGIDTVIAALPLLRADIRFRVYGTGPEEAKLRALAKKLRVEDRVEFCGYVTHEELPQRLREADIFIRASRSEGMGNSFIEAMAAGLPVIGTNVGGIPDFLTNGITGFVVDPDAPEQIADAVKDIMRDPEKVARIASAAQRLAEERYDWNDIADQMKQLLTTVCAR